MTDNFEHVLDAAPELGDLLAGVPGLNVLATSRAPLRLAAEHEYPIFPLELPSPTQTADPAALAQNEAVALFSARAQAVRPDFAVTVENASAIAAICAAADGLPLALELAAARIKVLAPEGLLERLRERLDLLEARARDVPERQRTIRAAIDWSYDLVGEAEQQLFARLSIFRGDFSLEAAEAVCAADVPTLELLVDSSLVQPAPDGRFSLLEIVRQRSAERLAAGEEEEAVGRRHLDFFLELAERLHPVLRGPGAETAFATLEREHDNLRAAITFARDHGLTELQLRFVRAINRLWSLRGYMSEGRTLLEEALGAPGPQPPLYRAQALAGLGALAWRQGDLEAAEAAASESVELLRSIGEEQELVGPLSVLGVLAGSRGDHEQALLLHEEMGRLAEQVGDGYSFAISLNNQAYAAWMTADVDRAANLWERCLAAARDAGTSEVEAMAVTGLGDTALARGDAIDAADRFREGLAIYEQLGFPELQADTCVCLAAATRADGRLEQAARLLGAAASLRRTTAEPEPALLPYLTEVTAAARAELGDEGFAAAFGRGRASPHEVVREEVATRGG